MHIVHIQTECSIPDNCQGIDVVFNRLQTEKVTRFGWLHDILANYQNDFYGSPFKYMKNPRLSMEKNCLK